MVIDYYDLLEVPRDASHREIKHAYRRASSAAHPDRDGGDSDRQAQLNEAWRVLSDPALRAEYDQYGANHKALRDKALNTVRKVVDELLNNGHSERLAETTRNALKGLLQAATTKRGIIKHDLDLAQAARSKIVAKGADDIVTPVIEGRIARITQALYAIEDDVSALEMAVTAMDEYEDIGAPVAQFMSGSWGTVNSTGGFV